MAIEQVLDLDHRDVLAAADDHVLAAAGDADIALRVDAGQVAGVEPVVGIGAVQVRATQVAAEVGTGAQHQAASLARRQRLAVDIDHLDLDAGQRQAIGREGAFVVILEPRGGDGTVLGHAPGRHDLGPEHGTRLLDQRARDRRASAQEGLERRHRGGVVRHGAGQVGQERGRCHREARALGADHLDRLLRLPDILQHRAGFEHDRHHQAVHEAGLVRHRRGHQHHGLGVQVQAAGVGDDVGHGGVGRMHHALGLAGRARGVDQLGDVVRTGAAGAQDLGRIGRLFPLGAAEQGLEAVGAFAIDDHELLQLGDAVLEAARHLLEVKAAEPLGRDQQLGLAMLEHEAELALAEDMHQRIDDRTDARAGQVGQRELPPVGQLAGHDVVLAHAQAVQADGHPVRHLRQLAVAEALDLTGLGAIGGQRPLVRTGRDAGIELVVDGAVVPEALFDHAGAARGQQYGVEFHFCLL